MSCFNLLKVRGSWSYSRTPCGGLALGRASAAGSPLVFAASPFHGQIYLLSSHPFSLSRGKSVQALFPCCPLIDHPHAGVCDHAPAFSPTTPLCPHRTRKCAGKWEQSLHGWVNYFSLLLKNALSRPAVFVQLQHMGLWSPGVMPSRQLVSQGIVCGCARCSCPVPGPMV